MRIHVLSDLHVDFAPLALPRVEADVTVLAGDVCPGRSALDWIRENCPERPVVYVLGNHEFYGGAVPKLIDDLRRRSAGIGIHVMENEHHRPHPRSGPALPAVLRCLLQPAPNRENARRRGEGRSRRRFA